MEISFLVGIFLSIWILFVILNEYILNRKITKINKIAHLEKVKCQICASFYFLPSSLKYWRCPFCGSINKK
jgi:ribosomal protein L37AE/L43A